MRKKHANSVIKRAIDSYPGGICFSSSDGRVILANKKMNQLVSELTGHTVLNAKSVWTELTLFSETEKIKKMDQPWLPKRTDCGSFSFRSQQLFFQFSDASVWRFEHTLLDDATVQIEAADITQLYRLSEELYENSIKLREMQERQRSLLENIVQVNENKELLAAKMRIHDEFGQCLLATNKAITKQSLSVSSSSLRETWTDSIQSLLQVTAANAENDAALRSELQRVAELIGCRIVFSGSLPTDSDALHLLYAAVREALTNAVRHANATELTVSVEQCSDGCHAQISDNGAASVSVITEGTGLGALRERLNQSGANLSIFCDPHVTLCIYIPYKHVSRKRGGSK